MAFPQKIKDLCTPAAIYFIISMIALVVMLLQNIGNTDSYRLGNYTCPVVNTMFVFAFKVLYILFFTWILNLICRDGHSEIAWLLILLPFILLFVLIGGFLMVSS